MNWTDINATPHAINVAGDIRILGEVGEGPGFLWYWNGDRNIRTFIGGKFESTSDTAGRILVDGKPVAFVSTIADTPEIDDQNAANGEFHALRDQVGQAFHDDFMKDQFQMLINGLANKAE